MHQHRDLLGRCSWNVSCGLNMAWLLLAVTGKIIGMGYGVVGPSWANLYRREISDPSARWVFDKTLQPVDRLDPGLWQIDYTHRHVSNQPRGKRKKHGTWDTTYQVLRWNNFISHLRFRRYHTRDHRESKKPLLVRSSRVKNCCLDCRKLQLLK